MQVGFNEGDFKTFRPKVRKILSFEYFLSLEIQLNYKNGFGRKKIVGSQFTLGPMAYATLVLII
jgi:hypothetical protein